ncbi:MAG: YihY/virulence factor BrkB family protein [Nonomuraea sp.]|nr:YihY/virulence factor BrkB family protein [Nonomuraea sp.]NUP69224.1 YihY/virulence factor BrkB family protein [Nonomuraea sp.]NUP76105.1 YihY/virulence factor BrkB family protein [Nonomuraea sp.]NUS04473.1 YihY/virulence factor BrkB family protein [Nonomuraea sp.]NUT09323.1 YihY/virulence factor BrkB family protein [Nonomuraea sp.]
MPLPDKPERPAELPRGAWWSVLKRTAIEFKDDRVQDLAAALTYYAVLSIFPALIVLVSVFGLLGRRDTAALVGDLVVLAPDEVRALIVTGVNSVQRNAASASVVAVIGLLVALWSASGYIAAFIRATNAIYDIDEGRPFWKVTPLRIGLTVLATVLLALGAVSVTLTGDLARMAGKAVGVGGALVTAWDILKWPVLALVAAGLIMVLYWAAPNVRQPGVRWLTPGGLLAVVLWVIVSGGFALYVAHFGSYGKTYGTLAGVVVFLIWLWLSNMALLLGAELDAELMRERRIAEGAPVEREPYVEPRDPPKEDSLPE